VCAAAQSYKSNGCCCVGDCPRQQQRSLAQRAGISCGCLCAAVLSQDGGGHPAYCGLACKQGDASRVMQPHACSPCACVLASMRSNHDSKEHDKDNEHSRRSSSWHVCVRGGGMQEVQPRCALLYEKPCWGCGCVLVVGGGGEVLDSLTAASSTLKPTNPPSYHQHHRATFSWQQVVS